MNSITKKLGMLFLASIAQCGAINVSAADTWSSSPVISSDTCESLRYGDVVQFLAKYYYPTLGYDAKHKSAGKKMMKSYAIASALLTRSQLCMTEALGLKEIAASLRKEQAILQGGTSLSKKEIEKHRKLSASANAEIERATSEIDTLTPEQRKTFGLGLSSYLAGAHATERLTKSISQYTKATKESLGKNKGLGALGKLGKLKDDLATANTVRVISKGAAGLLKVTLKSSKYLLSYAKKENIDVPKGATDKLTESMGW